MKQSALAFAVAVGCWTVDGCSAGATGGGAPGPSATVAGGTCNAQTQVDRCGLSAGSSAHLSCKNGVWTALEVCASGTACTALVAGGFQCAVVADAFAGDGAADAAAEATASAAQDVARADSADLADLAEPATADTILQAEIITGDAKKDDAAEIAADALGFAVDACWASKCPKETDTCKGDTMCVQLFGCFLVGDDACLQSMASSPAASELFALQKCGWSACANVNGASCAGKCGTFIQADPCHCDSDCASFGDCCSDYAKQCK